MQLLKLNWKVVNSFWHIYTVGKDEFYQILTGDKVKFEMSPYDLKKQELFFGRNGMQNKEASEFELLKEENAYLLQKIKDMSIAMAMANMDGAPRLQGDFAKTVRAQNGRQILVYLERKGDNVLLHQLINFYELDNSPIKDVGIMFSNKDYLKNENDSDILYNQIDTEYANKLLINIKKAIEGEC